MKHWKPNMPVCGEHKAFFKLMKAAEKMLEDRKNPKMEN